MSDSVPLSTLHRLPNACTVIRIEMVHDHIDNQEVEAVRVMWTDRGMPRLGHFKLSNGDYISDIIQRF